jgi:1-deoxy-D-xylulose-5-phosphate synthase
VEWEVPFSEVPVGKGKEIAQGTDIAVLSIGHPGNFVKEATEMLTKEDISVQHYDMRFVRPLDTEILDSVMTKFDKVITVEDGVINGGFGSAVMEYLMENGYRGKFKRLGIPDRFIDQGTPEELYRECGFDSDTICREISDMIKG